MSVLLNEEDIPGSSFAGRNPAQLKNEELRFWLKCRNDPTKAQLVKRYESTITVAHICKHNKQFLKHDKYFWNTTNKTRYCLNATKVYRKHNTVLLKNNPIFSKHNTIFAKQILPIT